MALVFNIKGKEQEIKFNFRLLFKANRKLSSKDPETGEVGNNGALNLFTQINEGREEGIISLIELAAGNKKVNEDDALESLELYMADTGLDDEEAYNQVFIDVKDEILDSGFFVGKLKKQVEALENNVETIRKHGTDEQKAQIEVMKDMIDSVKKEIS